MNADDLPDLDSLTNQLRADLLKAKEETTVDWSSIPLWKILATTVENPYGLRSKAGLRRLERAARKRALHKRKPGYNLDGSKRKPRKSSKAATPKKRGRPKGSKNKSSKAATTPKVIT